MKFLNFIIIIFLFYFFTNLNSQVNEAPKIIISYTDLSEKYQSILSKHEKSLITYCISALENIKREDISLIKVNFGSNSGVPYVFFEIPYNSKIDTLGYYDKTSSIVLLNVSLPVQLGWLIKGIFLQEIFRDSTVTYNEKNILYEMEPIIRISKSNGDYFEMYMRSNGIWYNNIRVFTKEYGIHSIEHASNVKMVNAYKLLLFQKPIDDLSGKPNIRMLVYYFFNFQSQL